MISTDDFLTLINEGLVQASPNRPWDGYIHCGSLFDCPMSWYRKFYEKEVKEVKPAEAAMFMHGNALHEKFQSIWANQGILVAKEVCITSKQYRVTGSFDGAILHTAEPLPIMTDIKTVDPDKFRMLDVYPEPKHALQLMAYIWLINHVGEFPEGYAHPFKCADYGFILYFSRLYSIMKVYRVEFNMDIIKAAVIDKVQSFWANFDAGCPPTEYLRCGTNLKCGSCRLNKKLVKELKSSVRQTV